MAPALTSVGLTIDTVDDLLAEFEAAELAGISANLDLVAPDPIAVVNGIVALKARVLEELLLQMYVGMNPDGASGDQLTGIALLTGTERRGPTATLVTCSITVNAAFTALAGTMFAQVSGDTTLLYTNVEDFTAGGAGTTTGVVFQCTTLGSNVVNASTLTVIASPLNHWTAITNPAVGVTGYDEETDAELRIQRVAELAAGGSTTAASISADVLRILTPASNPLTIEGIAVDPTFYNPFTLTATTLSCTTLWNDTDATDANGLPPHSIEVIAYAPGATTADNIALCALILASKAAGINTYSGAAGGNALLKLIEDDQGQSEWIYASRPTEVPTNITLTVKAKTGYTITEQQVKDAIFEYVIGTNQAGTPIEGTTAHWYVGATAYASSIVGAVFTYVPGVDNVTVVVLSAANVGADVVPTKREIVKLGTITPTIT